MTGPALEIQKTITDAVNARGYLDGWTGTQLIARQLVKQLEEACEAVLAVKAEDTDLWLLLDCARSLANWARAVFDDPTCFADVRVDRATALAELPDLVVPVAVLATVLETDMMTAALVKARADVPRGVG